MLSHCQGTDASLESYFGLEIETYVMELLVQSRGKQNGNMTTVHSAIHMYHDANTYLVNQL